MDLESISTKQLNEVERLVRELQIAMRKASLQNEPLAKSLYEFETQIGEVRRARFDRANPEYTGY
ncbi:MAG TPA: hypothetical protein VHD90_02565 [Phototrophicaceae bacterium]|nr:hypothetical protein [Phototrophicaceae bacterium]